MLLVCPLTHAVRLNSSTLLTAVMHRALVWVTKQGVQAPDLHRGGGGWNRKQGSRQHGNGGEGWRKGGGAGVELSAVAANKRAMAQLARTTIKKAGALQGGH